MNNDIEKIESLEETSSKQFIDNKQDELIDLNNKEIKSLEAGPLEDSNVKNLSKSLSEQTLDQIQAQGGVDYSSPVWKDLIKIPDVYSLELTFSSLIPDNFNNYLYGWRAANLDPIENYFKGDVLELGIMEEFVQKLIGAVGGGEG